MKLPQPKNYTLHELAEAWAPYGIIDKQIWQFLCDGYLHAVIYNKNGKPVQIQDFCKIRDVSDGVYPHLTTYDISECKLMQEGKPFQINERYPCYRIPEDF